MSTDGYNVIFQIRLKEGGKDFLEEDDIIAIKTREKRSHPLRAQSRADINKYKSARGPKLKGTGDLGPLDYHMWHSGKPGHVNPNRDQEVYGLYEFMCPSGWVFQRPAFSFSDCSMYSLIKDDGSGHASFKAIGRQLDDSQDDEYTLHIKRLSDRRTHSIDPVVQNGSSRPLIGPKKDER